MSTENTQNPAVYGGSINESEIQELRDLVDLIRQQRVRIDPMCSWCSENVEPRRVRPIARDESRQLDRWVELIGRLLETS